MDKHVIDTQTDRHTDAGNDNTRMPKLASGNKVWDDITYPFPNFNGATVEIW